MILDAIPNKIGIFCKLGRPIQLDKNPDMPKTLPLCWSKPDEPSKRSRAPSDVSTGVNIAEAIFGLNESKRKPLCSELFDPRNIYLLYLRGRACRCQFVRKSGCKLIGDYLLVVESKARL